VLSTQGLIWVDGCLSQALPLPDRGLDFGDGLFETLLLVEGKPLHLALHLQRLQAGIDVLGFPDCLAEVAKQISAVISSRHVQERAAMRVTLTRGAGPRGYSPPNKAKPRCVISVSDEVEPPNIEMLPPARLILADIRWGNQPVLAGIKHLNRLEQVLAAQQRSAAGADEVIMLDQEGFVISVSAGNIFIVEAGELLTPVLANFGVLGTRRRQILDTLAPVLNVPVRETRISVEQLESASEVFYSNALIGVRPVASFESKNWSNHELCASLANLVTEVAQ
jgi:4-amino-4-deoxychorismate lyase